ncbi:MAG TPA: DUF5343 domain-containing protein [Chloroflexia bacterium]|nr:DUF5343 domain-containing protein [Chloroflexia bacterium]
MIDAKKLGNQYVPESTWWTLRKKFAQSIPTAVTRGYLSTVLGITPVSAKNLIPALRGIGLIDDVGKPTELANRWRNDTEYPKVCEEIRTQRYPQELLDLFPEPGVDYGQVKGWFQSEYRLGDNAASKLARFYLLLLDSDPNKQSAASGSKQVKVGTTPTKQATAKTRPTTKVPTPQATPPKLIPPQANGDTDEVEELARKSSKSGLSLHIDLQIHISPDASPEQIDKLFESMAKNLPFNK